MNMYDFISQKSEPSLTLKEVYANSCGKSAVPLLGLELGATDITAQCPLQRAAGSWGRPAGRQRVGKPALGSGLMSSASDLTALTQLKSRDGIASCSTSKYNLLRQTPNTFIAEAYPKHYAEYTYTKHVCF